MSFYVVVSRSQPDKRYLVYVPWTDAEEPSCECWPFRRKRDCPHIQQVIRDRMAAGKTSVQGTNTS